MRRIMKQFNIKRLWHFTDKSNLPMIEKYEGLFSLDEIERKKISVPVFGGNDWSHEADFMEGVDIYVHLCFVDSHPMQYITKEEGRIEKPIWLAIKPDVLLYKETRFTNDVSNKVGVDIMTSEQAAQEIDFEVLFSRTDWSDPEIKRRRQQARKSEILVHKKIPINLIESYKNG